MKNYIKYAKSQWLVWLGLLSTITSIGFIPSWQLTESLKVTFVIICFAISFAIPFVIAIKRCNFKLRTIGKSNVSFAFGDLFKEKCFVVTTNRYFDVNPTGDYIAKDSLLGKFVEKYFPNNVEQLEALIAAELSKTQESNTSPFDYGTTIKIQYSGKIIYLLVFTDRIKTNQTEDFYEKTVQGFLETIVNENHGLTISVPLIGDNNNLSDTGFDNSATTFKCLMAMINIFETRYQRSEIKLKIVVLPEKRAELIKLVQSYSK